MLLGSVDTGSCTMKLRVIVVDEISTGKNLLGDTLVNAGYDVVAQLRRGGDSLSQMRACAPDFLVINLIRPTKDCLLQLNTINQLHPLPVIMFAQNDSQNMAEKMVNCGVSAYVVDGLKANRIVPIIKVAIARFSHLQGLHQKLAESRRVLEERKIIERAKGIIMNCRSCSEDEAYRSLRKLAMDKNQRLVNAAENIISAAEVFG